LAHSGFKNLRIDQCDQLSFGDLRIEVGVERLDIARYLAADLYRDHGVGCASGRDGRVDISTLDARRAKFRRVAALEDSPSPQSRDRDRRGDDDDQLLFCHCSVSHLIKCVAESNGFFGSWPQVLQKPAIYESLHERFSTCLRLSR